VDPMENEEFAAEGGEFRPIPGLDSGYGIMGWTPDGGSLYVAPIRRGTLAANP